MRMAAFVWILASVTCAGESTIQGTLTPPAQVKRMVLLDRAQRQEMTPKEVRVVEKAGAFDGKTGAFLFKDLNPAASYDLFVELNDGTRIEGVDMTPKVPHDAALRADGKTTIEKHFYGMKQFCNENRVLQIAGNGKSAAVLVELCRTSEFHSGGKDVIWRIERWDYVEQFGAWQPDGTTVLRRFRLDKAEWTTWRWYFVSAWGGLRTGMGALNLQLPDLQETPGRYPGVKPPEKPGDAVSTGKKKHEEQVEVDSGL